jgi:hypothetical protein
MDELNRQRIHYLLTQMQRRRPDKPWLQRAILLVVVLHLAIEVAPL